MAALPDSCYRALRARVAPAERAEPSLPEQQQPGEVEAQQQQQQLQDETHRVLPAREQQRSVFEAWRQQELADVAALEREAATLHQHNLKLQQAHNQTAQVGTRRRHFAERNSSPH